MYVRHPDYAPDALHYLRAYTLLQDDLLKLFEYVEPADANESTYSFRCLELLLRACGEVESNCRVILDANGFVTPNQRLMEHYKKLNTTHHLASYSVRLPVWTGGRSVRQPFAAWQSGGTLPWFKAHHGGKHNRHAEFPSANLANVVDAVAAVVVLLAAQFLTDDFGPMYWTSETGPGDGFEYAIGHYFQVKFPTDWAPAECYEFEWEAIQTEATPFRRLSF
jgi:hypothetical protein